MNRRLRKAAGTVLPPVAVFALVVILWEVLVAVGGYESYLLPGPGLVAREAWLNGKVLLLASLRTGAAALCGFLLSFLTGCLIAFLFAQSRIIQRSLFPYAIFLQTVPIVAIAPLIILWFHAGFQSIVLVSFIVGLFPIITNATAGLTSLDRNLADLFRLLHANRLQVLLKLRLPNAIPYLVAGARTSSGLSVIGAIVGEFFAGHDPENFGLGYLVLQTSSLMKTAYLFACILASTLLGLLIFGIVTGVGRIILSPWHESEANQEPG